MRKCQKRIRKKLLRKRKHPCNKIQRERMKMLLALLNLTTKEWLEISTCSRLEVHILSRTILTLWLLTLLLPVYSSDLRQRKTALPHLLLLQYSPHSMVAAVLKLSFLNVAGSVISMRQPIRTTTQRKR